MQPRTGNQRGESLQDHVLIWKGGVPAETADTITGREVTRGNLLLPDVPSCTVLPTLAQDVSDSPNPAWTVRQVAEYLSVNERTVYRMAERGELPAFKVGDAWRFRREDIDAWIERQQQERSGGAASKKRRRSN